MDSQAQVVDFQSRKKQRRVDELLKELAAVQQLSIERAFGRPVDWELLGGLAQDISVLCATMSFEVQSPAAA